MAMTRETGISSGDDVATETEKLLAWYESGLLDPDTCARLDAYLANTPGAEARLQEIREEKAAFIAANEALGAPSADMLENLLARLENEDTTCRSWSLRDHLHAFLASFHGPARSFALVVTVIILVQAAILGALLTGHAPEQDHSLASGPPATGTQKGTRLLIAFTDEARMADISSLLKTVNGSIISGPRAGGLYMIRVSQEKLPPTGIKGILAKLKAQPELVRFAASAT